MIGRSALWPAKRQPQMLFPIALEGSTANHVLLSALGTLRVHRRRLGIIAGTVPIRDPFPDIADHVEKIERVMIAAMNRRELIKPVVPFLAEEVGFLAAVLIVHRIDFIALSSSRRVFPLRFGRQSAFGPSAISARFLPRHHHPRKVIGPPPRIVDGRFGHSELLA